MKMKKVALIMCLALFAGITVVQADTINLSADVTGSTLKYRWSEYIGASSGGVQVGNANDFIYRGILEWDTSKMPSASQISHVEISLMLIAYGSFDTSDNMDHIVGSGTVVADDYNSAALYNFGEIVASGTLDTTITYDVTDQVLDDLNNGRSYSSFRLYWPGADGEGAVGRFIGAPELIITTVPEPVTMGLVTFGALGLLARRKR